MYISLRIRKRVMLCVIAVLSMLAAVAVVLSLVERMFPLDASCPCPVSN